MVLGVNIRFVILTRKGRGIESQSFLFLLFVSNQKEEAFVTRRDVSARKGPATKRVDESAGARNKKEEPAGVSGMDVQ